jgi:hypothetical protein
MLSRKRALGLLAGAALVLGLARPAHAERVRFHYGPGDVIANAPAAPGPAVVGQRISLFGGAEPYTCSFRPTAVVTFRHCSTGQPVSVPLRLPDSVPRIEHRGNRVIYNYGSQTIEIVFTEDGGVDVVYNSGFLRPLGWCFGR